MIRQQIFLCFATLVVCIFLPGCSVSPTLSSIQVTPATQTAAIGGAVKFTAMGTYTHGSHPAVTRDITNEVTWASSNEGVATIDSSGLAATVGSGTTSLTARMNTSFGPLTGNATLEVTGATTSGGGHNLTTVTLVPATQTLNTPGETAQFIAIGTYDSSPSSADMTDQVAWQTSDASVATVNSSGLATAVGCATSSCSAAITASATAQNGNHIVGVGNLSLSPGTKPASWTLTNVNIIPSSQVLNTLGESAQFIALGTFSISPTTQDLTTQVTWQSSNSSVATVNPSTGLATAVGCATSSCVATITAKATSQNQATIVGVAALTVSPGAPQPPRSLTNITIIPGTGTQTVYALGETAQFLAIGTFSSSPVTQDMTNLVTWKSVDVDVATINTSGLATAVACAFPKCTTTILASTTSTTGAQIVGTSDLTLQPASGGANLPSLTVYIVGAGNGSVSSNPAGISCTPTTPTTCIGYFPSGTSVRLTATPTGFGGWSSNCVPTSANPCTVVMNGNQTVGAIFN